MNKEKNKVNTVSLFSYPHFLFHLIVIPLCSHLEDFEAQEQNVNDRTKETGNNASTSRGRRNQEQSSHLDSVRFYSERGFRSDDANKRIWSDIGKGSQ